MPPFAVAVKGQPDVVAALAFASAHSLRVVVKSSGHEFQGRSTAANALLLWMHELTGITVHDSYTACPGDVPGPAITVSAGNNWGDVYAVYVAAERCM